MSKYIKVTQDKISDINDKIKSGQIKWSHYSNEIHYYKIIKK
jgi:hypothetical protein